MKTFENSAGETQKPTHEKSNVERKIGIINELQIRVARELLGTDGKNDNEIMFAWVDKSKGQSISEKFRLIIETHPEFIEQYEDLDKLHTFNQDFVVAKIEELLRE